MTQKVNNNFADIMDMEPLDQGEDTMPQITVDAHEITVVENPDLPDMTDIDTKMCEGEKQLEVLIDKGICMTRELYDELPKIEPKYRNRHMEITSMVMGTALDAIKHKTELQLKKKEQRLKEKSYGGKETAKTPGGGSVTNNNFFGNREELMKFIKDSKKDTKN